MRQALKPEVGGELVCAYDSSCRAPRRGGPGCGARWTGATLVRTIFDQPAAEEVHAQHARVVESLEAKHPDAAEHLAAAEPDLLAFTAFPRQIWRQIWSNNPQ